MIAIPTATIMIAAPRARSPGVAVAMLDPNAPTMAIAPANAASIATITTIAPVPALDRAIADCAMRAMATPAISIAPPKATRPPADFCRSGPTLAATAMSTPIPAAMPITIATAPGPAIASSFAAFTRIQTPAAAAAMPTPKPMTPTPTFWKVEPALLTDPVAVFTPFPSPVTAEAAFLIPLNAPATFFAIGTAIASPPMTAASPATIFCADSLSAIFCVRRSNHSITPASPFPRPANISSPKTAFRRSSMKFITGANMALIFSHTPAKNFFRLFQMLMIFWRISSASMPAFSKA